MEKIKRLLASFIAVLTLLVVNPVGASADWKQNDAGWWYTQGSSYATGWRQISGQWYYFDNNGYMKTGWLQDKGNWYYFYGEGIMAHDTTIDGCYLNSSGTWSTNSPTNNTTSDGLTSNSSVNQGETAYLSATGKQYHKIDHCGKMNPSKATKTTVKKAEQQGIGRCNKCW